MLSQIIDNWNYLTIQIVGTDAWLNFSICDNTAEVPEHRDQQGDDGARCHYRRVSEGQCQAERAPG